MTTPSAPPPAGWYPAPDGSATTMWWDGARWVPEHQAAPTQQAPSASPPMQPAPHTPGPYQSGLYHPTQYLPVGTHPPVRLALATQILLVVAAVASLVNIGVELFGISGITAFVGGDASAISQLESYDRFTLVTTIVSGVSLVAAGVLWVVWQFRAAKQVPGRTRRGPGWHAGAWFVPVIAWWFPYQNISDLWRAVGRTRPGWQIVWWVLWIASNAVIQLGTRLYTAADDFDLLQTAMWTSIVGDILLIAAMPFAVLVVRGITRGLQQSAGSHG
jgi:hypothetical protein